MVVSVHPGLENRGPQQYYNHKQRTYLPMIITYYKQDFLDYSSTANMYLHWCLQPWIVRHFKMNFMSKKSWLILYSKLPFKIGQDFLDSSNLWRYHRATKLHPSHTSNLRNGLEWIHPWITCNQSYGLPNSAYKFYIRCRKDIIYTTLNT